MTRFWPVVALLLVLPVALIYGADSGNWDLNKTFHTSPGKKLVIDLDSGGDIQVTGGSGDDVVVKARFSGRDASDLEVNAEESQSGVEVTSHYSGSHNHNYNADANLVIEVPARYDVSLETMGGSVTVTNVDGTLDGKTMGGDLDLDKLKGTVDLTTMGGAIHVSNSDLGGSVHTMGGDVLFKNVAGNVKGSSMGGSVKYEGSRPGSGSSSSSGEARLHSMGGDINLDSAPNGASVETMGGDIHITSAIDHVNANTMGGDINIDSIDGRVKASTMGGDVQVVMTGDPSKGKRDVDISSMSGNIELTVPAGLSMTFDLEIVYHEDSTRKPKITSDFPVNVVEEDADRDCGRHHEECKRLRGTGTAGSGANRIRIHTVQGDITIKKGA